jgi:5-(carboxyamino)imidazole ribonucleotide synthase
MAESRPTPSVAIVGGGQLGMMLVQASSGAGCRCEVMDASPRAPASAEAPLFVGDVQKALDVLRFGVGHDVVTIEKEAVSVEGLRLLEAEGVKVFPQPDVVALIQDKGRQKTWLERSGFPTPGFSLFDDAASIRGAVAEGARALPFVQKLRRSGYDGRGVFVVGETDDLDDLLDGPSVVEERVDLAHELSVLVARSTSGEVAVYDPVEMVVREGDNVLDMLVCPAGVSAGVARAAQQLAREIVEALGIVGLLAVEMFVDEAGTVSVNELAPRPHNSGHHTIESCATSQYEQHLRAILGRPLGDTRLTRSAAMVNLLGAPGHRGRPHYRGVDALETARDVHLHLYGKDRTWPMRKMGHVTVCDPSRERAMAEARRWRRALRVEATTEGTA